MVIQDTVNHRKMQYKRYDDLLEDNISLTRRNATALEVAMLKVNAGAKRRVHNNHAERLAKFKASK
jgi:hypothetical protein